MLDNKSKVLIQIIFHRKNVTQIKAVFASIPNTVIWLIKKLNAIEGVRSDGTFINPLFHQT
jgi:hypothetical protein